LIDYDQFCGGTAQPDETGELTVQDLRARLAAGNIYLVDVREPFEAEISRIPGSVLIPLGELPERMNEVPRDRDSGGALQGRRTERQGGQAAPGCGLDPGAGM